MKNALYFLLPGLAVVFVVFAIAKWGLNPRPVPVMDPSFFDAPEELGVVLYRRFFVEVEQNPVILWGVEPQKPAHLDVVAGFVKAAAAANVPMAKILLDEELAWGGPSPLPDAQVINFQNQYSQIKELAKLAVEKNEHLLLITKFNFTTQRLAVDTLSKDLRVELGRPVLSMTHLNFVFNSGQEDEIQPSCKVMESDLAELGCLSLEKSRSIYRKAAKFPRGKWVAMLDQWPGQDMILYMRYNP